MDCATEYRYEVGPIEYEYEPVEASSLDMDCVTEYRYEAVPKEYENDDDPEQKCS